MNIIAVCGSYVPRPSAVGVCAKNVVEELHHRGHTVTIICERNATYVRHTTEEIDGTSIKHISTYILDLLYGNRVQVFMYRVVKYARAIFLRENIDRGIVNAYVRAILECHRERPVDVILPFCFPYESIVAVLDFKKAYSPNTYVAPMIFDNFVENPKIHRLKLNMRLKRPRHLKRLKQDIGDADAAYICHSQKDFVNRELGEVTNKVKLIEHPLLLKPQVPMTSENTLLYSGAFLKNYVKSSDFAKVLEAILPKIASNIEFCVMGNDLRPIISLAKRFPQRIFNNGRVPYAVAQQKMAKAGVLLSVGEVNGIQISSKIFTYMSTGKPIIHFYYSDSDINKAILEKYPLAHSFSLNRINEDSLSDLCSFIQHNCVKRIAFDEISMIYEEALPKTLVDDILAGVQQ